MKKKLLKLYKMMYCAHNQIIHYLENKKYKIYLKDYYLYGVNAIQ